MISLTDQTFTEAIFSDKPVLVDFWKQSCVPCRHFLPILENLESEFTNEITFSKVNVQDFHSIAVKYDINLLPTILVFRQGKVIERIRGVQTAEKLIIILDAMLDDIAGITSP